MKYRFLGNERPLSFAAYPPISLAAARAKRDAAKKSIDAGLVPSVEKKLDRLDARRAANNTFGLIAGEFLTSLEANGAARPTPNKNNWLLEKVAAPFASRPIAGVTPAELLDLIERVEHRGCRETARRLRKDAPAA